MSAGGNILHTGNILHNSGVDWSLFNPEAYCADNYRHVRDDDRQIVATVRDFFARNLGSARPTRRSVEIGAGANLYPSLAMLPFSRTIEICDRATSNLEWLNGQRVNGFDATWDGFWEIYQANEVYRAYSAQVPDIRAEFRQKTTVVAGNVFDLPRARWDLGTMFFVACGISADLGEFTAAVRSFVRSLKAGSPFAIAFMTNSDGYTVADQWFPAVSVGRREISEALTPVSSTSNLSLLEIASNEPIRKRVGMLLATGFAAST